MNDEPRDQVPDKARSLCIVDPFLRSYHGHYHSYASSLLDACHEFGVKVAVLGNRHCLQEIRSQLGVRPALSACPTHLPRALGFLLTPLQQNLVFYRDMLATGTWGANWTLFAVNADHHQLIGLAAWLRRQPRTCAPTLVVMHRVSYLNAMTGRWVPSVVWLRLGLRMLERLHTRYRIRFVTDSAVLASEYQELTRLPLVVVPIPHTRIVPNTECEPTDAGGELVFATLGAARTTKGFPLVVDAIQSVRNDGKLEGLRFALQGLGSAPAEPAITCALRVLREMGEARVFLLDGALNAVAYRAHLARAAAILIPYQRAKYHANTSGTFAEALAAGKPVVVTEGTWMSQELQHSGAGVTCRDGDAKDLARAILEVRDNYEGLAQRAAQLRASWIRFHSPHQLVRALLHTADGASR